MKVVHVETGRHLYGGARQALYLIEHLPALGVDSVLVCATDAEVAARGRDAGVTVIEVPMRGDLDVRFAWRLASVLRQQKADLVHIHGRRGADTWGALGAKLAGVPALLSRRVDNPESWLALKLKYPLYGHVVAISEAIRQVLIARGVAAGKITTVHDAINPEGYQHPSTRADFASEFGVQADGLILGVVAQLIRRKGHQFLFEAFARIAERHPAAQLVVFGQGPLEQELKALANLLGIAHRLHFAGFRDDLPRWLGCLDLLTHPALIEGMGVSLLQASAAGVAIVASRTGGIPEAVADGLTGLLVSPGDSAALATALDQLLTDHAMRRRLGAAGPAYIETYFTAQQMAMRNREVYRQLTGR